MKIALTIILFISLSLPSFAFHKKPVVTENQGNDTVMLPDLSKITLKDSVINFGKIYLSLPYRYGGTTPRGFDCSGFTSHVFNNFGINLNRTSRDQASQLPTINKQDLQTGDLVFFEGRRHNGIVGHVGIVTETKPNGEFNFIHSSIKRGVTISSSEEQYYGSRFVKGGRALLADNTFVHRDSTITLYSGEKKKSKFELVPKNKKQILVDAKYHKVKKGETLSSIAQDYDVPVSTLKYLNGLKNSKLKRGKKLIISEAVLASTEPTLDNLQVAGSQKVEEAEPSKVVLHYASMSPTPSLEIKKTGLNQVSKDAITLRDEQKPIAGITLDKSQQGTGLYKVKAGESLFGIARTHNLTVEKLKSMNNLKSNNITPGQLLAVMVPQSAEIVLVPSTSEIKSTASVATSVTSVTPEKKSEKPAVIKSGTIIHLVKKGDTLYSLSRQYGCKVAEIKDWNRNLDENLRIGDKIKINQ